MKIGEKYKNGQIQSVLENETLTIFFKTGFVKAKGSYINSKMHGEWKFYRLEGELWQIGHFQDGMQHGEWIRYDRNGKIERHLEFQNGKMSRKLI